MDRRSDNPSVNLPKILGPWTRSDRVRRIGPEKIFEYMDGAGELYIGYRFGHLEVTEYLAPDEDKILVELYWMESSDDAFGLLSGDWSGEPVNPAPAGGEPESLVWPSGRRGLYGAGLLRMWSDNLYVRIMAYRESPRSREAVLKLAELISQGRRNPPAPALLKALPPAVGEQFRLRADRVCYFRSHLVLNSVYFLSTTNILDLDKTAEAATGSYIAASPAEGARSVQVVLINYQDEPRAAKAMSHFERAYFPEKDESALRAASGLLRVAQVEDGWLGWAQKGRALILVFQCSVRDSASQFVAEVMKRLDVLEARDE